MLIAVVNGKGGVGKSTLAVHAAAWLADRGRRVAFLDADAQETSSIWIAEAAPDIPITRAHTIDAILAAANSLLKAADVVIADGPAGIDEQTIALVGAADLVIVPCCPSVADLRGAQRTVDLIRRVRAKRSGRPRGVLVLNRLRPWTKLGQDVIDAAPQLGLPVARHALHYREAYADAPGQASVVWRMGSGAKAAADEIAALLKEITRGP